MNKMVIFFVLVLALCLNLGSSLSFSSSETDHVKNHHDNYYRSCMKKCMYCRLTRDEMSYLNCMTNPHDNLYALNDWKCMNKGNVFGDGLWEEMNKSCDFSDPDD